MKKSIKDSVMPGAGDMVSYLIAGLFLLSCIAAIVILASRSHIRKSKAAALPGAGIAVVSIDGIISLQSDRNFFGESVESSAERIVREIRNYADDTRVKAIVLAVNSPGGSPSACEEIYRELMQAKQDRKIKVVAYFKEVAASGGYYVSMPADYIVTTAGVLTGSVGVILSSINFSGLMDKFGVKYYAFTSGKNKDMLSPFRKLREDEMNYGSQLVKDVYTDFRKRVMTSRKDKLRGDPDELLDGRVFSGNMAVRYGLADAIGVLDDAVAKACELSGLDKNSVQIIEHGDDSNPLEKLGRMMNGAKIKPLSQMHDILGSYHGLPMLLYIGQPE